MGKGKKGAKKGAKGKKKKSVAAAAATPASSGGKAAKTSPAGGFSLAPAVVEKKQVWVASETEIWELVDVVTAKDGLLFVKGANGKPRTCRVGDTYTANKSVEADMTALHHIHEPAILHNLNQRSISDEPYTLMGPVLVAVNPLQSVPNPDEVLGKAQAASHSHPYGIAEVAFQQLNFAHGQKKQNPDSDAPVNQSVVVGGESGAGKTESSKMVLRHLVSRASGKSDLDKQLLGSNPILEAFGNATTLRNHNSSRFGKFMKLHFKIGKSTKLSGASVVTYLLERSRVTAHGHGERNYHIFYQLLEGAPSALRKSLGLTKSSDFVYLTPSSGEGNEVHESRQKMNDKSDYKEMHEALKAVKVTDDEVQTVFQLVAGILHLGNIKFVEDEANKAGDASKVDDSNGALKKTAELFGLDAKTLSALFCERKVRSVGEVITAFRDANSAGSSRDAVAKGFYSKVFDWIITKINKSLCGKDPKELDSLPYIGVLDIFGFESFQHNDFEQLLINFTNEALQATFNKQVFEAEADLYRREGLVLSADESVAQPQSNTETMKLLVGEHKNIGILTMIDQEGRNPNPSDEKLLNNMHRAFQGQQCFIKPHPRDKGSKFIVQHYAGLVQYTVGQFLFKNSDRLPNEITEVFANSSIGLVKQLWEADAAAAKEESKPGKKAARNDSIVKKFNGQIMDLVTTLDSTRCSFIRCVKPNRLMVRNAGSTDWFSKTYVTSQLKCLSIPATAAVLQTGLPTRIMYSSLTESYKKVLPKDAIKSYELLGGGDERAFVSALFWAFNIPRKDYKLGLSRVFFRSGMLAQLEKVLDTAKMSDSDKKDISKRFKHYYARSRWRNALVKIIAVNRFTSILRVARGRLNAAATIQAARRRQVARRAYMEDRRRVVVSQNAFRALRARREVAALVEAKKEQERLAREAERERIRLEQEKAKKEKEAKKKAAAEAKRKAKEAKDAAERKRLEKEQKEAEEAAEKARKEEEEQKEREEKLKAEEKALEAAAAADAEQAEQLRVQREADLQGKIDNEREKFEQEKQQKAEKEREKEEQKKNAKRGGKKKGGHLRKQSEANLLALKSTRSTGSGSKMSLAMDRANFMQPAFGTFEKLDRGKKKKIFSRKKLSWKTRYFALNKERRMLSYYGSSQDLRSGRVKAPRGQLLLREGATVTVVEGGMENREFVLKIQAADPKELPLHLSYERRVDLENWKELMEECIKGFTQGLGSLEEEEEVRTYADRVANLTDEEFEHVEFLTHTYDAGGLTKEDYNAFLEEFMQNGLPTDTTQNEEKARKNKLNLEVKLVMCTCGTPNQMKSENEKCSNCAKELKSLVVENTDDEENLLRSFKYKGGLLRFYHSPKSDHRGMDGSVTQVYGILITWYKDGNESTWSFKQDFRLYQDLHSKLSQDFTVPSVKDNLGLGRKITKKREAQREEMIRQFWIAILNSGDRVLEHPLLKKLFELELETAVWEGYKPVQSDEEGLTQDILDSLLVIVNVLRSELQSENRNENVKKDKFSKLYEQFNSYFMPRVRASDDPVIQFQCQSLIDEYTDYMHILSIDGQQKGTGPQFELPPEE